MKNLFILGSTGYIGSRLSDFLRSNTDLSVFSAGRTNVDVHADLQGEVDSLVNAAKAGDVVVFLSSISAPDVCANQPELVYQVNVTATLGLINQLTNKGVKVIFSSTDMVFGEYDAAATDNSQLKPFGYYGKMKADVEHEVINNDLVKVVRLSYVIGIGDKYTDMLSAMAADEQQVEVFDGFERNAVAIDDVLQGIYNLTVEWDEFDVNSINFGGPQLISRIDITQQFADNVCSNLNFKLVAAPEGFWHARPKTIEMYSEVFSRLLGREPMSVEEKFQNWRNK